MKNKMFAGMGLAVALLFSCGFTTVPLGPVANSSRVDAQAADGKGGWLDLGSNDLHVLEEGAAHYAGIKFEVPAIGDENSKTCLILGRKGAESATLKLTKPTAEGYLYLLHATANGPAAGKHAVIGKVTFTYDDGSKSEKHVRQGEDVADWTDSRNFVNAARGWTAYNHNTQVSLYVARFHWQDKKSLTSVTFEANGTCPWMILAAATDGRKNLRPLGKRMEITGTYSSPAAPTGLKRFPAGAKPKNIILIIGDGMGQALAQIASYHKYGKADAAYFQQLPIAGICTTFSANADTTDSAASATAFATGTKTSNGVVGLQVDSRYDRAHAKMLTSVAALAHAQGRGVGIVTTDTLYGATPAGFFAHVMGRGESEKICAQAAECGYDVIIATGVTEPYLRPVGQDGGKRTDGRDLVAEMEKSGYRFSRTIDELAATPRDRKMLGTLSEFCHGKDETSVARAFGPVLARLGENPKGFFMMAECAGTDYAGHGNNPELAVAEVSKVEFMAEAAVEFAKKRGDTLVVVTADHTTGGPIVVRDGSAEGRLTVDFTSTSHTSMPVPVHAYGPGAERFEGLIDNTDIAHNVMELLSL